MSYKNKIKKIKNSPISRNRFKSEDPRSEINKKKETENATFRSLILYVIRVNVIIVETLIIKFFNDVEYFFY